MRMRHYCGIDTLKEFIGIESIILIKVSTMYFLSFWLVENIYK